MTTAGDTTTSRASPDDFENILNFRDVGKTVNDFLGRKLVREGLLYRSARPDDATLHDRRLLVDEFGIKTIIDLRTKTEHINAAKKRQADVTTLAESNAALLEPMHIAGIRYLEIKLTGRRFEKFLLSQLSWWSFIKFLFLFLTGFRMRAIAILGREVMLPRGLVGLGLDTLDNSGPEIAETLNAFLSPGGLPALIHCTQGKDRTGIIAILVLLILGVPIDAIEHDYRLSDEALLPEKEARLVEIRQIGLTDEWGETSKTLVSRAAEHLVFRYGGIDSYLDGIGFGGWERDMLREVLAA
ncbi:protein-tyrosine phosphatase-like protein [Lasiosphaeris hirsuta]|uniref:Protein-tyrosine phosphatase-like protein n=1 Tax=Lasiosphaeris hirsuta TaxID=260670 RepID=A0AA40E1I6_9PEZI|nr:protein-tyrosine phosphatase-like protein [Lasiosphaeris hirsuta]